MSSRRGTPNLLDPALEDRPRVVRAGARFRVELNRARAELRIREPLDRAVVQRLMCRAKVVRRRDGEAVVLTRHEDTARRTLEHRMVAAPVPERELERREAGRESEELVPEADAEYRNAAEQLPDRRHLVDERLRIPRPVREEHPVVSGEG